MYLIHLFPSCFSINFAFLQFQMLALNYSLFFFFFLYRSQFHIREIQFTFVAWFGNVLLFRMQCCCEVWKAWCILNAWKWLIKSFILRNGEEKFLSEVIINIIFSLSLCQQHISVYLLLFFKIIFKYLNIYVFIVIMK